MIPYPHINPVILHIWGPFAIRWYALSYIIGALVGCWFITAEAKKRNIIIKSSFDTLLIYIITGIVVGGRLFDCLIYYPKYFLTHPLKILYLWEGGMAFHGGLIGLILSLYFFARKHQAPFSSILDLASVPGSLAILMGRLANFINAELYGRPTASWVGMIFPTDPAQLPRHPSQLYEAFTEGLMLFIIQYILYRKTKIFDKPYMLTTSYLILYSIIRFFMEFFRAPDAHIGLIFNLLSLGQILSLLMLLFGILVGLYAAKKQ